MALNPKIDHLQTALNNRNQQMNPNNPKYGGSKKK